MNPGADSPIVRRDALRREFDEAFARPPRPPEPAGEPLLRIRAGRAAYALRRSELAGVERLGHQVRVPSRAPAFVGVAAIRGRQLPVFSLALLLEGRADDEAERWVALVDPEDPLGLSFSRLDGHASVAAGEITPGGGAGPAALLLPSVVRLGDSLVPLVSIAAIVRAIKHPVP